MKRVPAAAMAALAVAAVLSGCSGKGDTGGRESGRPPVAVEADRASTSDLTDGVDVVGTLAARFLAEVKSEVGGTVSEVHVTEWVRVKKGQPLARVDTRETEAVRKRAEASVAMAGAGLLESQAAAERAGRELERAQRLKADGLVTQQSLDDAVTQREAAVARVAASRAQVRVAEEEVLQAKTRISKAVIRAPFDGEVAERSVNVGEVVGEMQKVVFRIVDNRLLDLTASVPSGESGRLRTGQPLAFSTDAAPGKTFAGRIKHINPVVSEADRTVRVVAEVRNDSGLLKSGMFVTGRIATGMRRGVLLAPRSALLSWDVAGGRGDLFVLDNGVARLRGVRTGIVDGDRVEIVSGLSDGETVVTRGGFNVRDGDRVSVAKGAGGS